MKIDIRDIVKTVEDALKVTNRPACPSLSRYPKDLRKYMRAQYNAIVIAEALNEGWEADYNDHSQPKYYPWHWVSSSGFAFLDSICDFTHANSGGGARLCFRSREISDYAGKQFLDVWKDIMIK